MIFYSGPSMLDGKPIVGIVTGHNRHSINPKTGPLVQTWIIRSDMHPADALRLGEDESICGDCTLRPGPQDRACYVSYNPIGAVYRQFSIGNYMQVDPLAASLSTVGKVVRLGAYGDPVAIPLEVWHRLLAFSKGHVGYTHQWRACPEGFKQYCMASVESEHDARQAQAAGWRTYRVRRADEGLMAREIVCPASNEAKHKTTCLKCRLCNGASAAKNIAIVVHGTRGTLKAYERRT